MTAIKTINNISVAKLRFSDAVSRGIDQLMKDGFNREHSTAMLVNCIRSGRKDCLDDKEVFKVVNSNGVNLNEAVIALTVASSLRQVISTQGLSPAEAINVLTERIRIDLERQTRGSTNKILVPFKESHSEIIRDSNTLDPVQETKGLTQSEDIRHTVTKQQHPINVPSTLSKLTPSKNCKKANSHSHKNVKAAPRKRVKAEEITSSVKGSSASDETNVKIELVTKSMLNHDDVNINKDSNMLNKVSRKRNRSAISEDEHNPLQSPVMKSTKRPRV